MVILSLDLSLECTGYAIFDTTKKTKKTKLLDYGIISNKHLKTPEIGIKLLHIEMVLKTIQVVYRPDIIVVEGLTGGFGDSTKLARVHGIMEKVFIGINIYPINNKTFKKEFTGSGKAEKEDVASVVLEHYPNLPFRTYDETDAIGIGIYHQIKHDLWIKK